MQADAGEMERRSGPVRTRIWRVFYTFANAERRIETHLRAQQIEVLLPERVVVRQWSDRKKKIREPLFKNYIFARVDEGERLQVLQVQGVVRCVAFGGQLAAVSEEEIEQLVIAQNEPERLGLVEETPLPARGSRVKIEEGSLKGLTGEVVEHRGERYIVIQITAIRQAVRVAVPADAVCVAQEA